MGDDGIHDQIQSVNNIQHEMRDSTLFKLKTNGRYLVEVEPAIPGSSRKKTPNILFMLPRTANGMERGTLLKKNIYVTNMRISSPEWKLKWN